MSVVLGLKPKATYPHRFAVTADAAAITAYGCCVLYRNLNVATLWFHGKDDDFDRPLGDTAHVISR